MPKSIKKRVTKKKKPDEDEVKGKALEALNLLKKKQKILIYALSTVGLVIIIAVTLSIYFSSVKKKAYSFEVEAYNYYNNMNLPNPVPDEQRWKTSLELFQKASDKKPSARVQFYIGNCYFNLGDYDNAVKEYLIFIDRYKRVEKILPLVYQRLASAYMKSGKTEESLRTLDALAQFEGGIFRDTALILQARYYEAVGKPEEAEKKYREIVNDFPSSLWASEARAKIQKEEKPESGPAEEERKEPAESEELTTEDAPESTPE
ncbi:MAG: tetratricopeptide repeat protein [Thermodesulfovibrionia bacterium]|nr:tetratricopeptide repeat protein [Thermodesulfovibrionia bacterium]